MALGAGPRRRGLSAGRHGGMLRCPLDRGHDVLVAGAAAQVPFDAVADLLLAGVGMALQQPVGRHDHAGRAEATLQAVLFPEPLLQRMQLAIAGQTFDGQDLGAIGLYGQDGAGLDRQAVHDHGARAALRGVAADMRARQANHVADIVHEQEARLHVVRALRAVDGERELHASLPSWRSIDLKNWPIRSCAVAWSSRWPTPAIMPPTWACPW